MIVTNKYTDQAGSESDKVCQLPRCFLFIYLVII